MIRDAKFADISSIVLLFHDAFARSHYAKTGISAIDEPEAKRLLVQAIQRHGQKQGGATFVQVSENDGVVEGLILGTLSRVYVIGDRLMASDLFWLSSERVSPGDPYRLMKNMVDWAWSCPAVVEVRCGTTSIIHDPEDAGKALERLGLQRYGLIWRAERAKGDAI